VEIRTIDYGYCNSGRDLGYVDGGNFVLSCALDNES